MKLKSGILNILFWSVISAAFIGPGTITTAAKAGATFQFDLLWALSFSIIACLVLQEASARITIISGMNLGQAIYKQYENQKQKWLVIITVFGAIILGSAAYETGNILGAISGLGLIFGDSLEVIFVILICACAFIALSLPSIKNLARFLGFVVVIMGVSFFITAILVKPDFGLIVKGSFIPDINDLKASGSGLLVLGLIGTTVVPYNLFLGSGISSKEQKLSEMRFGLAIAIILGGIISMAVLVTGSAINGEFSFQALGETISNNLGTWALYLFGFGLFTAGFTSAITAPLASAITARSITGNENNPKWSNKSFNFKLIWFSVLIVGFGFGISNVKPVPAIIIAQALNGFILPFISVFLLFVINNKNLMGKQGLNSWISNVLMTMVVWVTLVLGIINLLKAAGSASGINLLGPGYVMTLIYIFSFITCLILFIKILIKRNKE
ncbi:NRAMP family divalent metal transporter [Bacteroidota bacterium]